MLPKDRKDEEMEELLFDYGDASDDIIKIDIEDSCGEPADVLDDAELAGLLADHEQTRLPQTAQERTAAGPDWKKPVLITVAVTLSLIMLALCCTVLYINYLFGSMNRFGEGDDISVPLQDETVGADYTGPTLDVTMPTTPIGAIESDNVINIMLLGEDERYGYPRGRTDSMILCTINKDAKTITMTSFLRDLYVTIPGYGDNRLNAAYVLGGIDTFKETMLWNFGVEIDEVVMVELDLFAKVVDILGGVTISMTQKEIDHLYERYPTKNWSFVVGANKLNGAQALAYSRIREIDSDFARSRRQQTVLKTIFNTYRSKPLNELLSITEKILPNLTVTMDEAEIWSYAYELFPMLAGCTLETNRIPVDGSYTGAVVNNMAVLVPDLDANREVLESIINP